MIDSNNRWQKVDRDTASRHPLWKSWAFIRAFMIIQMVAALQQVYLCYLELAAELADTGMTVGLGAYIAFWVVFYIMEFIVLIYLYRLRHPKMIERYLLVLWLMLLMNVVADSAYLGYLTTLDYVIDWQALWDEGKREIIAKAIWSMILLAYADTSRTYRLQYRLEIDRSA
ncbi:hypothetical protein ACFBZI_01500 [Moraxella sp. ZJ142]|uniref:hypothetical protein n=1 Tax=Moraxella marmotae TaxID=3344520 RepID=UPI0035D3FCBE